MSFQISFYASSREDAVAKMKAVEDAFQRAQQDIALALDTMEFADGAKLAASAKADWDGASYTSSFDLALTPPPATPQAAAAPPAPAAAAVAEPAAAPASAPPAAAAEPDPPQSDAPADLVEPATGDPADSAA